MKLKYFIPSLMAVVAAMFTGCSDDNDPTYLSEVRVSQSMVSIDANGGSTSINVEAVGSWTISGAPAWLTVSPASGTGNGTVTFSAGANAGRNADLLLTCEGKTQNLHIVQGLQSAAPATCAEIIAGPDSKTYRVTGIVNAIANTTYGNWYLKDNTGEVYIYGTLDAKGATKNFLSLGLEVGDEVTVEGPKTTYNGTVELVDVTVIKINKSLIKCNGLFVDGELTTDPLPVEGGEITAYLTCKGEGVAVEIPEDAKSWLGVVSSTAGATPTVTFRAAPNTGGDRSTTVIFKTTDGSKEYTSQATISQKGAIIECSVANFLAAPVGDTQYRITGVITNVAKADYGNIYIKDYSGEVYVYGVGSKGDFVNLGLKAGDVITLVGKRGEYKGTAQMTGGQCESSIVVPEISIADFRNLEDNTSKYYRITGVVSEATESGTKNDVEKYGNFNLTDATGSVYIYGVVNGWGGPKGQFGELGVGFGDNLTILAYKTTYKGLVEGVGVYYSHEKK